MSDNEKTNAREQDEQRDDAQSQELAEPVCNEIDKAYYDPLDHLEPLQQRFAQMKVTTTFSNAEIGRMLNLSNNKRYKWEKDKHVKAYIKQCQRKYGKAELAEAVKAQTKFIRENMFSELFTRFDDPDQALKSWIDERQQLGLEPPSLQEQVDFKARFAKNASFKDIMSIWEKTEKSTRLDANEPTEIRSEGSFEAKVLRQFSKHKTKAKKSKTFKDIASKAVEKGMSLEDYQKQLAAMDDAEDAEFERVDSDSEPIELELEEDSHDDEWEHEFTLEEWEIRKG